MTTVPFCPGSWYSALSLKHLGQHSRLVVSIGGVLRSADSLLGRDDGVALNQSSSSSSHDTSNGLDTEGQQKRGCPIQKEQILLVSRTTHLDRTGQDGRLHGGSEDNNNNNNSLLLLLIWIGLDWT